LVSELVDVSVFILDLGEQQRKMNTVRK